MTSSSPRRPPHRRTDGKMRQCFGAHFVEVEVDTRLGTTRITKYVAVHESGRIINPQTARDQIRGAVIQGIGQALHEDLLYDPASGQPLTTGLLSGPASDPSRRPHDRGAFSGSGRWVWPLRGENRRGVWHHSGPGCGRERHLQCHRQAHDVAAHHPRQNPGGAWDESPDQYQCAFTRRRRGRGQCGSRHVAGRSPSPAAGRICCSKSKTAPTRPTS